MYVVTLPPSETLQADAFANFARQRGAELLEIRGDLTPSPVLTEPSLPLLYSPRGADPSWALGRRLDWVDLEENEDGNGLQYDRLIRSYHDHEQTPDFATLQEIADRLKSQGADHIKIAVRVNHPLDITRLMNLQDELGSESATVLAMGPMAGPHRWLSPWRNAMTYGFVNGFRAVAEGQVAIEDLCAVAGENPCRLFGVLGGPNMRSASPLIHNALLKRHGVCGHYFAFATKDFNETWSALNRLGVEGLSVTAPYKHRIIEKMERLGELAQRLGSVNTCLHKEGAWVGHQRDVGGFVDGYPEINGKSQAIVIGSGGVVPAVIEGLKRAGIKDVVIAARNLSARRRLAREFEAQEIELTEMASFTAEILVGTLPVDRPDLELPRVAPEGIAIDLRYGKPSDFLRRAAAKGFAVRGGAPMLAAQALAQFSLFTGISTDDEDRGLVAELLERFQRN